MKTLPASELKQQLVKKRARNRSSCAGCGQRGSDGRHLDRELLTVAQTDEGTQ